MSAPGKNSKVASASVAKLPADLGTECLKQLSDDCQSWGAPADPLGKDWGPARENIRAASAASAASIDMLRNNMQRHDMTPNTHLQQISIQA